MVYPNVGDVIFRIASTLVVFMKITLDFYLFVVYIVCILQEVITMESDIVKLDTRSRNLLEECIMTQGVEKTSLSKTALRLEELSFIIIRDYSNLFEKKFLLSPTLIGEEYMDEVWSNEDNE